MDKTSRLIITPSSMTMEGAPLNITQIFQMTCTCQLESLKQMLLNARYDEADTARQDLYDFANQAYGNVLSKFFPSHNDYIDDALIDKTISAQDAFIKDALEDLQLRQTTIEEMLKEET